MSPTGSPDFNQNPTGNNASPSFDNAEDTNRLLMGGGAQSRGGRWIWATGFENGLGEIISTLPGALTLEVGASAVYQGAATGLLTTSAVLNNEVGAFKTIFSQGARRGVELIFSTLTNTAREISFSINGPTGTDGTRGQGKIVLVINAQFDGDLYVDVNGVRTLISQVDNYLENSQQNWHYAKLVYDSKTNTIVRFLFDDLSFELNTPGYTFAQQTKVNAMFVMVKTLTATIVNIRVDNMIITTDEP